MKGYSSVEKNVFIKPITLYQVHMLKELRSHILRHTVGILYIRPHYPFLAFLTTLLKSLAVLTILFSLEIRKWNEFGSPNL